MERSESGVRARGRLEMDESGEEERRRVSLRLLCAVSSDPGEEGCAERAVLRGR